jgi:hypothetical protein
MPRGISRGFVLRRKSEGIHIIRHVGEDLGGKGNPKLTQTNKPTNPIILIMCIPIIIIA